ncbi:NAD(P)/FAD-dependent oxidoreductase [Pseudomonas typographi]|uniref:FAD-binding oxidoreductase n=1 Tax=Pseudomonas typographi TaxID=2715964 RepID=A0ABR7Z2Z9_9PSED|nr:FAD-dependent oxidoreductase [Pseudomonas typographi]MBD1554553.1 FAD-binding oxidoreductase [Pseudomonas typographi]MBD1599789.1 FAD-binding oxidoreductase [Pseudomonas typographi]
MSQDVHGATPAGVIVIGAGLVGSAVAYGLARAGVDTVVLDQGDNAFRASRGNFGLVWVQGKGYDLPDYARWTRSSATRWPALAEALLADSGIDVQCKQPGGFHMCFSDDELLERQARLHRLQNALGDYPFQMLDAAELKTRLPLIGPAVVGASYSPQDGHVNPLKLLRALHASAQAQGARLHGGVQVDRIDCAPGEFCVSAGPRRFVAPRIVLAAGLGNPGLARQVGLQAPVAPNRGQVLISERVRPFLAYPTINVRQTDEGTVQLGDSMEEVDFDDGTTTPVLAAIARRAVATFPLLQGVGLVRAWAALRVMSPDGYPIYQQSNAHPGAFVVTCHSGVTLAAAHALRIAPWILGGAQPDELGVFTGERFLPDKVFSHAH